MPRASMDVAATLAGRAPRSDPGIHRSAQLATAMSNDHLLDIVIAIG